MNSLETEFWDLAGGLVISSVGFVGIIIALSRIKTRDFTLLTFGLFCFTYGIRWLDQTQTIKTLAGFPFTFYYFNIFLTYILVISLALFFVQIFGKGIYNSMLWVFWSTVAYALIKVTIDLVSQVPPAGLPVIPAVVIIWCSIWVFNLLVVKKESNLEIWILRIVSSFGIICIVHDQIVNMNVLPWSIHLEHLGFIVFFTGMAFSTAIHFFSSEKRLMSIEQEVEIARQIQQSNLPEGIQSPDGITMAARYVPMSAVAGDFYDIHIINNKCMGVLIADVSGHGIGAALIGSMLKIAFASQVENLSEPSKMLEEINRILQGKIEDSFVTACYVYIDLANKRICYSNAGHPSPILYRKSGTEGFEFSIGGTILGPFKNSTYETGYHDLRHGDRIVLYTDGLIETKNEEGRLFGESMLKAFIEKHVSEPAEKTADKLLESLLQWSGRSGRISLDDDLTLVIIDVNADLAI